MQSLFPQYGNVFGGNNSNGRNELVSFNAGKMTVQPTANGKFLVTPDLKKGKVCLTRGDDQLLHFQWVDRQTGASPDDFIIFPDDATFTKASTGREGDRVYLLQYKNSSRRFFFWMQHKDSSRDEELANKLNDFMNNASASAGGSESSRGGAAGNVQLDHNAIMQMLGAMGAGDRGAAGAGAPGAAGVQISDLQNILQNMGLPTTQAASPATSAASSSQASHGASSAAATTASTHHDDVSGMEVDDMTEEELLRLAIEESMRDVQPDSGAAQPPAPSAPSPAPTPTPTGASNVAPAPAPVPFPSTTPAAPAAPAPAAPAPSTGSITAADLQRAMASIQAFAQPKSVSLMKLLSAVNVTTLLQDENAISALLPHLPEGAQTPHELQATLRSPQFRQSVASLASALQTGNFNAVLTNFGLDPTAGAAKLTYGDSIGAFLDAIQHWANQQDTSMTEEEPKSQ
ncbi:hypothetical protein Poli38472_011292 [Pythium oligandrum]|uniref:Proteasomal ubiquitin receptor ADRM1 n=1 Tax=Pythium oligandrum TaxID=41045 RepID=A0A8K1CQ05_PYTOL|nr:hypothetical protein Poli38472_011292 [Pythium oligandrum]|eukprot:TMW67672.1 hypothetical protein Poli38472_011292 [Pythium oligandrum]